MDTPAKAALGGGLISTLAVGGMVVAGVLATSAAVVVIDPGAPAAQATGLVPFEDCDSLRDWYVDHAIDEVGPWGWGGQAIPMYRGLAAESQADSAKASVSNGDTGTNTQEAGVDEPDVAKTDGRIVVRLEDGRRLVVTDVSGARPRELATWPLPRKAYADGLLLVGDHALLSSTAPMMSKQGFGPSGGSRTELIDVDLSDPADPRLAERSTWAGTVLSMRQYGDTIRLVTSIGLPELPFVQPAEAGRRGLSERESTRRNREVVRSSRIEDWIPGLECSEVYHPQKWSGPDTVTVATFRPGATEDATRVAVTGAGSEVYSSTDRLYVTSMDWSGRPVPIDDLSSSTDSRIIQPVGRTRTHLHAFALDGDATRYVASGTVDGSVRNRWSLDEHDGHLRVAVSWPSRKGGTAESGVVVMDERDGRLEQVGELTGLGVREEIQSVRWFDDLAVVVTFRQIDPLYTIDLTDPTRPRKLGELKIPGFSSYLHPIGDGRLLGVGTDASRSGENLGAQAAVFDINDTSRARQVGKVTFGRESWFDAAEDPHAFTWLPGSSAAIAGLQRWGSEQENTMVLLEVSPDGAVSTRDLPQVGGWGQRALPLPDGRVALVGERVEVVDVG